MYFQRATEESGLKTRARLLAEEGLEALRNQRDLDFASLSDGSFGLNISGNSFSLGSAPDVANGFSRTISVSSVSGEQKQIDSSVSYSFRGQTRNVNLSTFLTNWQRLGVVVNWEDPNVLSGSLNLSGTTDGVKVAVSGNFAYVVRNAGSNNFVVVDITNPASPTVSSTLSLSGTTTDVKVSGTNAYVGRSGGGGPDFASIDISTPATPALLSSITVGRTVYDVWVSGNYVYAVTAAGSDELRVIDVSNPSGVSVVAFLDLPGSVNALSVAKLGNFLGVGRANGELNVVSVANPLSPSVTGTVSGLTSVNDIAVGYGNYLYLADSLTSREVSIYSLANPASPSLVGGYNSLDILYGIAYDSTDNMIIAVGSSDTQELIVVGP